MHGLSSIEVLRTWEAAAGQHPVDRALTLLAPGGEPASELRRLPIGERDRRLWELREATFGPNIEALALCPNCGGQVEFQFSVADVRSPRVDSPPAEHEYRDGEWSVSFRLPDSLDLAVIAAERDRERAEAELAGRCVVRARRNGLEEPPNRLPSETWNGIQRRMSELDPQAEVSFQLVCPLCRHQWHTLFDIGNFLWSELNARARRLVREVDLLARAYGWSESEILRLSPARRQLYLELAGA